MCSKTDTTHIYRRPAVACDFVHLVVGLITGKVLAVIATGLSLLLIPLILIALDPMYLIGKYNFRLANGTILHQILSEEMEAGKFQVFLFNITNADSFLAGHDHKLKMKEIGPFTYLEYRTHRNLLFKDGVMTYTPELRSVFVPEESVALPADLNVTMPNIPMLSATTLISSSPPFVRSLFNFMMTQFKSKPIVHKSVQDYLWGYKEPLLSLANNVVPGLIHFESTGIMEQLYDKKTYYQLKLGTTDADKFSVKSVKQYRIISAGEHGTVSETTIYFNDTYEGMAYPPKLAPDSPINIFRVGICRPFPMTVCGKTTSKYGPDALVYEMGEKAYGNRSLCNSKGFCPKGLMDMSSCYFGLPLALSKGHFLDADPEVFDRIEGLKPVKEKHSSHITIEPKIGLTLETSLSLQVNIVLGDLNYSSDASKFSDIVLPIVHFKITQPRLPEIAITALTLMYITMPKVFLIMQIAFCVTGVLLLCYSIKLLIDNGDKKYVITTIDKKSKYEMDLIDK